MFDWFVNVSIMGAGILRLFGCVGGLAFIGFIFWLLFSEKGGAAWDYLFPEEEYRCRKCGCREWCHAAFTGVEFPCPHYKKAEDRP